MSLHGKEKIWFFIYSLLDEREVIEDGKPTGLHPASDLNNHYSPMDFIQMVEKIEKEHNAARLIAIPTEQTYNKYLVRYYLILTAICRNFAKTLNILIGLAKDQKPIKSEPISVTTLVKMA